MVKFRNASPDKWINCTSNSASVEVTLHISTGFYSWLAGMKKVVTANWETARHKGRFLDTQREYTQSGVLIPSGLIRYSLHLYFRSVCTRYEATLGKPLAIVMILVVIGIPLDALTFLFCSRALLSRLPCGFRCKHGSFTLEAVCFTIAQFPHIAHFCGPWTSFAVWA